MDTTNSTMLPGMMMGHGMYGGSFVDILLRHVMLNGWESITIGMIVTLAMSLSMERLKVFVLFIVDKIVEYVKTKAGGYVKSVPGNVQRVSACVYDKIRRAKPVQPQVVKPDLNKFTVSVSSENKVDLYAIGNFLLRNKNRLQLNSCSRRNTDKYKTNETYSIPEELVLDGSYTHKEDLQIVMSHLQIVMTQNIKFGIVVETDNKVETLKNLEIVVPQSAATPIAGAQIYAVFQKLVPPVAVSKGFNCKRGYAIHPGSFIAHAAGIDFYIYYTKNFALWHKFYKFQTMKEEMDLNGKKYKLSQAVFSDVWSTDELIEEFLKELEVYCDGTFKIACKAVDKAVIDKWVRDSAYFFEPVLVVVPAVKLSFESTVMTVEELAKCSRHFMNDLVAQFYEKKIENTGEKISIYQLQVKYTIEKRKIDNPRYAEWVERYEPKEDEKKKAEKKDEKEGKEEKEEKASKYKFKQYMPYKPDKFIEEEVKTPVVETVHIKSDKKPFEYLYLQKSHKETLLSYLNNFKNGRELYYKMGIPYKGGILLSGTQGCGKSSTIVATATYLNKDIYYLDLGKIKTNHELKLCIDHIRHNSQKGGVIIFEDIDCMTDIVRSRELGATVETGDDKLSLSFLLNVLDGTLSPEDVIFVMTTNHPEVLDPALIRPGRIDISITIERCNRYQLQRIFFDLYARELDTKLLNRFPEYKFITAEVILHLFHNIYNKDLSDKQLLAKFIM